METGEAELNPESCLVSGLTLPILHQGKPQATAFPAKRWKLMVYKLVLSGFVLLFSLIVFILIFEDKFLLCSPDWLHT